MQSSNSEASVLAQAQAAASEASASTPVFAEAVNSPPPSLLQGLQERAHAGLQATAQIVKEQAALVTQAASERVKTARAGKNLLDEGGEMVAQAVLAKKAAIDASDLDRMVADNVERAIVNLDDSVAKLKIAESAQQTLDTEGNYDLAKIATEHEERAAAFRQVAHMLETPTSSAQMSPEEFDALAIVQTRAGCATVLSKTSAGLDSVKQKTLASFSSVSTGTAARDETASAPAASAAVAPAPTLLQGLRENAMTGLQNVKQATNERIDTAKAGKRLLDDGGDAVAQLVVAKKATLGAAVIDRNVAQRVQSAIFKLEDSAAKLRAIQSTQRSSQMSFSAHEIISHSDAEKLADEHEMRAKTFRQIADMLKDPISSLTMNLAEWDAHSFVRVRASCGLLQCRTNEGFEAVKSLAYTSCDETAMARKMRSVCA